MQSISRQPAFSTILVKNQRVIPRVVREQLKLKPGDILRYRVTHSGVLLDNATEPRGNPFAIFSERASESDERAYDGL